MGEHQFGKIRAGDVVVCPVTSPAWSVVFPSMGALVTDGGGILSHPAIIAREHGIPAVVGTGNATSVLRDGQRVTVDGGTGVVEIAIRTQRRIGCRAAGRDQLKGCGSCQRSRSAVSPVPDRRPASIRHPRYTAAPTRRPAVLAEGDELEHGRQDRGKVAHKEKREGVRTMRTVRTNARTTLAAIAACVAIIVTATPAAAISSENSSPAPERTEVGFLGVAVDVDGDGDLDVLDGYCSGTMIDSDTFLTAAHCTDNFPSGQRFFVSLEQDVLSVLIAGAGLPPDEFIELGLTNGWIVEGDMHRHPGFPANFGFPNAADQHDIAVIDFADRDTTPADLWTFTPATLPTAGQLDAIGARALDGYDWWVGRLWRTGGGARPGRPHPSRGFCAPEGAARLHRASHYLGTAGDERVA